MIKYPDIMFDLETYGISHSSAILQLAAVPFNLEQGTIAPIEQRFDKRISLIDSIACGCTIDQSTIDWWETQDEELHKMVRSGTESLHGVLHSFNSFINEFIDFNANIWSHATFDPPILAYSISVCDIKPNYKYWQMKDLRTLQYLSKDQIPVPFVGTPHNAMDDCLHQIEQAVKWRFLLKGEI